MPEGLDLYSVIFETESDSERMSEGATALNNAGKEQVSGFICILLLPTL